MQEFVFHVPARIHIGTDTISQLGVLAADYGERALIVTETAVEDAGIVERARSLLERASIGVIVYDEIASAPDTQTIGRAVSMARAGHVQLVIGIGGPRVLTVARCVAAYAPAGDEFVEALSGKLVERPLSYLEVATSGRHHGMLRDFCVVSEGGKKLPRIIATQPGLLRHAIIDSRLLSTLSHRLTLAVVLDTMLAGVEGYLSARSNVLSDTLFLRAVGVCREAVEHLLSHPDDPRAQVRACEASFMTALGLSTSSQGIAGAVAYAINARFDVPKAWVAVVLLPYVLDYFETARPTKITELARALGARLEDIDQGSTSYLAGDAARRILGKTGLPARLRDLDLKLDDLMVVADAASEFDLIGHVPAPVSSQELYDLLRQAF